MAAMNHLFLLAVRGGPKGFQTTLRALAYASSPNIIPYVGFLWSLALMVFAEAYAHQTELWRPVVASLIESAAFGVVFGVPLFFFLVFLFRHLQP